MEAAGCRFLDEKEMQAHIDWLREEDRIDELLREADGQRKQAGAALMLIYCDSVILMYFFDHVGPFNVRATNRLAVLAAAGDRIAISDLVRLEYRVLPLKTGDTTKLTLFDAFCSHPDVRIVPITTAVFERATTIRATHNFKLADSLHLAAAVETGCDDSRPTTPDSRRSPTSSWKCCRKPPNAPAAHTGERRVRNIIPESMLRTCVERCFPPSRW